MGPVIESNEMKEVRVNDYLSLRLKGGNTYILVSGEMFQQCRYVLMNIETTKLEDYADIKSIDEIIYKYNSEHEYNKMLLDPETEFFVHCSNLQAWAEYGYDTRLLDHRLAFSLLKKLTEKGDPNAKKIFKEEITKRLTSGYPNVVAYLLQQGYFKTFSDEEKRVIFAQINHSALLKGEYTTSLPVLDRLIEEGDPNAKNVLKEEVAKRLSSGVFNVIHFILDWDYLKYFTNEQKKLLFEDLDHSKILELNELETLSLLQALMDAGDPFAKNLFKKRVCNLSNIKDQALLQSILSPEYFTHFTAEEKQAMFKYIEHVNLGTLDYEKEIALLDVFAEVGVKVATKRLKKKILSFLQENEPSVIEFISTQGYVRHFSPQELAKLELPMVFYGKKIIPMNDNKLNLHSMHINDLYEVIGLFRLKDLRELSLWDNELTTLPDEITNLKSLQFLGLGGNNFTTIPKVIERLPSLKTLRLSSNHGTINTLPIWIGNLQSLENLSLFGNELQELPETIGNLTSLKNFDLHRNQLSKLPETIGNLTSLEELNLEENRLATLPETIGKLTSLRKLYLPKNQLTALPETIGNLTSLEFLWLGFQNHNGNLTKQIQLPKSFEVLKRNPHFFEVSEYHGKKIPKEEKRVFRRLEEIFPRIYFWSTNDIRSLTSQYRWGAYKIENNRVIALGISEYWIDTLPECIQDLKNLKVLSLISNKLTKFPRLILKLPLLERLVLMSNKISKVPEWIFNLKNLKYLDIRWNPLDARSEGVLKELERKGIDVYPHIKTTH